MPITWLFRAHELFIGHTHAYENYDHKAYLSRLPVLIDLLWASRERMDGLGC